MAGLRTWFQQRTPTQIVVFSFLGLILVGTILLKLPFAHHGALTWTDALFTATSATCVTGLIVRDTGKDFTIFGQIVILIMIQLGGLGLMTISTTFLFLLGRRLSFQQWRILRDAFGQEGELRLPTLIRGILFTTLLFEILGTVALTLRWSRLFGRHPEWGLEPARSFYYAVFHAISAFCNAGFSLFSDSLTRFRTDPVSSLTVAVLFIIGGLGYFVLVELFIKIWRERHHWRRLPRVLSLHTRLVLTMSLSLILLGTAALAILESGNQLQGLRPHEKVLASFFQAVTPRTAGFNTLPIGNMTTASLLLLMILMLIGASPGSTGGGIKTTTAAILLGVARAEMTGQEDVILFDRRVPRETVHRAIAVAVASISVIALATLAILVVEAPYQPFQRVSGLYLQILFETISAFGTVGLSTGLTPMLSDISKWVLCLVMLAGRIGPVTFVYSMAVRTPRVSPVEVPEEAAMIG